MNQLKPIIFSVIILLASAVSFAQSGSIVITEPVKYNDFIIVQQDRIGKNLNELVKLLGDGNTTLESALNKLEELKDTINIVISDMDRLREFKDDKGFRNSARELFLFYKRTMEKKYSELITQLYSDSPDQAIIDKILNEVTVEEAGYDNIFIDSQKNFADSHNFTLEDKNSSEEEGAK